MQKNGSRKVYYRSGRYFPLILAGVFLVLALLPGGSLFLRLIFFAFGALMAYSAFQIRLVTSPEGIEYHQIGYDVRTTWDNVAHIGNIPAGRITTKGLILHEPALQISHWLAWNQYIKGRGRFIPLSLFLHDWQQSTLGQDIKQYAPNLFAHIQ